MAEHPRPLIAHREFATESGPLSLRILGGTGLGGPPSCEYRLTDAHGRLRASLVTYGVDSMQALLFCVTAAGDYLARFEPDASFAGLGVSGLLHTDPEASGQWRALVTLPADPEE